MFVNNSPISLVENCLIESLLDAEYRTIQICSRDKKNVSTLAASDRAERTAYFINILRTNLSGKFDSSYHDLIKFLTDKSTWCDVLVLSSNISMSITGRFTRKDIVNLVYKATIADKSKYKAILILSNIDTTISNLSSILEDMSNINDVSREILLGLRKELHGHAV